MVVVWLNRASGISKAHVWDLMYYVVCCEQGGVTPKLSSANVEPAPVFIEALPSHMYHVSVNAPAHLFTVTVHTKV